MKKDRNSNKRVIDTALCEIGSASKLTQGRRGKNVELLIGVGLRPRP
jgi:hypothetical protein